VTNIIVHCIFAFLRRIIPFHILLLRRSRWIDFRTPLAYVNSPIRSV